MILNDDIDRICLKLLDFGSGSLVTFVKPYFFHQLVQVSVSFREVPINSTPSTHLSENSSGSLTFQVSTPPLSIIRPHSSSWFLASWAFL